MKKDQYWRVRVDADMREQLDQACDAVGLDRSELLRMLGEALVQLVKRDKCITLPIKIAGKCNNVSND
jgi:antitoxin component of RelBE/YafQ-DinJ toxin-antitoxin module